MVVFSGFYESPGPPLPVNVRPVLYRRCDGHQNGQPSKEGVFCIVVLLIVALATAGAIRSE
jgi:hypothetical protein